MAEESDAAAAAEQEAIRLKSKAESKYKSSDYKSALKYITRAHCLHPNLPGAAVMTTAFTILHTFHVTSPNPNHYKILGVEPYTPINIIRTKYKKLAFLLHPDKNPLAGADEAFNLVVEAFKFLSDKAKRKEFDTKLRVELMKEKEKEKEKESEEGLGLGFWTVCGTCRVLHQFERKYLGQRLVCPGCDKSFEAVEFDKNGGNPSEKRKVRKRTSSVGEVMERSEKAKVNRVDDDTMTLAEFKRKAQEEKRKKEKDSKKGKSVEVEESDVAEECEDLGVEKGGVAKKSRNAEVEESGVAEKCKDLEAEGSDVAKEAEDLGDGKRRRSTRLESANVESTDNDLGNTKSRKIKRVESEDLESTAKDLGNSRSRESKRVESEDLDSTVEDLGNSRSRKSKQVESEGLDSTAKDLGNSRSRKIKGTEREVLEATAKDLENSKSRKSKRVESENERKKAKNLRSGDRSRKGKLAENGDLEATEEEESEVVRFNDFNKDKRSFEKGQVWATYDEGDGMPRYYGLVDEVVSFSPFKVKISWLDRQDTEEQWLASWEKMGLRVPCGRFKVSGQTTTDSVHTFSHLVNCNRVARQIYRIYPKKGSVWAMYNEAAFESEGSNLVVKEKLCYDVVVFLTSYSEMHGLSTGYLEKIDGFNSVFKRREIGAHAIRCLEKDDLRFISHEIPAKKLKGTEAPDLPKDCWELDPASLPLDLLTFG